MRFFPIRDVRLDVVLPLTLEDYLEDFATEESRKEFEELLGRCRKPVLLRMRRIQDDRRDPDDQAELRRDAYDQVGRYVVDHCDVLIAVWDGQPSRGRGGTAEIVQYAQEQNRPIIRVWGDSSEVLNRDNNNGLDASALDAIDQFNRQAITPAERASYVKSLDREHFEKPKTAAGDTSRVREFVNVAFFLITHRPRSWPGEPEAVLPGGQVHLCSFRGGSRIRRAGRSLSDPHMGGIQRGTGAVDHYLADLTAGVPETLSPRLDREQVSRRTYSLRNLHGHLRRGTEANRGASVHGPFADGQRLDRAGI